MNLRPIVRPALSLTMVASVSLALAACGGSSKPSAGPTASASASACAQPGSVSDAVTVTGAFGKTPTISVKGSPKATGIERTVITKGTGGAEAADATVQAHLSVFDVSGKKIEDEDAYLPLDPAITSPAIVKAMSCVPYGSRTVTTGRGSDFFTQMPTGINAASTYIVVADVEKAFVPAAWTTQVPTVTFDAKGTPTLKLAGAPMAQWSLKVLQQGSGAMVKAGDNVTVDYQGTSWNTGKIFDQSYGKTPATFNTTQVVPGFGGALVGQKVGTKLVVTIPPLLGYGTDASQSALANQTLVFVIDIEKATSAS